MIEWVNGWVSGCSEGAVESCCPTGQREPFQTGAQIEVVALSSRGESMAGWYKVCCREEAPQGVDWKVKWAS
jgi:hypothetical protein